ncbi:MAG: hypothetical protein NTW97_05840 [Candidatus Krumholzibacteria bacterium]|nr:hypothetical protein [Candidatus Krumholzibacteria bacterium]
MMRMRGYPSIAVLVCALALACLFGCDESTFIGDPALNQAPTVRLTGGPPEGDTTSYRIKFSWMGNDPDGTVEGYEYVMCDGSPGGFDPADTTGLGAWTKIHCTDSTFAFSASENGEEVNVGVGKYSSYCRRVHTFFIRAVDDKGTRSRAAYRSFTASTLAPYAVIESPHNAFAGREQQLPSLVRFTWRGEDPIDDPWNVQEPESIRYFLATHSLSIIEDLNRNPENFESRWCPWIPYHAPGDSGTSTIIGDDEIVAKGFGYIFAVQAKDEAGAVTSVFDAGQNVRIFRVFNPPGPLLTVRERNLGSYTFIGGRNRVETFRVPGGFTLDFGWTADASAYGAIVSSYRYGWDVVDLSDPSEWDVLPSPLVRAAPLTSFRAGVHTLYIEATDNMGTTTLAQFEFTIFPMKMTRNLLWVDDFYSTNFPQTSYAFPTEKEHDDFWLHVCSRARDFDPGSDVYETASKSFLEPDIEILWKYKNIIWTYSAGDDVMAWDDMVRFTPESWITETRSARFNYLAYYASAGGHIWTEGKSDSRGGLGAVLSITNQSFPRNLRCEIAGQSTGCEGDTSGVNSIAYRTYCVTVIDKVRPAPRIDPRMPDRRIDYDAMAHAFKDTREPLTTGHPDLPNKLTLWSQVTKDGMFFDPKVQGFTYVEVYNPTYWMRTINTSRQLCFSPMYRMRTRNVLSAINGDVVAFWTTRFAGVIADAPNAVDAPSVHFGFPLWFFNRAQVDSIADVIFDEWAIGAY